MRPSPRPTQDHHQSVVRGSVRTGLLVGFIKVHPRLGLYLSSAWVSLQNAVGLAEGLTCR